MPPMMPYLVMRRQMMHPISIIVMTRVVETVRSVVLNPIALVWRDPVIRLGTI